MNNSQVADTADILQAVRSFVVENFLFGTDDPALTNDASFLETGIIDSTGILELVTFVETKYGISVGDSEMLPENLDSLSNVSSFIARKLA
jgi:acyl carrier protein